MRSSVGLLLGLPMKRIDPLKGFLPKRPVRNRFLYDPLKGLDNVCRIPATWEELEEDDVEGALKTLARFRKDHPEYGRLPKEKLVWGYAWAEAPVLLDLGKPPQERVEKRLSVIEPIVAFCHVLNKEETVTYSAEITAPPSLVLEHLFAQEAGLLSSGD